ncbi:MAG: hypothetical protein KJ749_11545 [Planctomycetes bacterium]|nr:hypothetical protein [Planctomycetota bacterium]
MTMYRTTAGFSRAALLVLTFVLSLAQVTYGQRPSPRGRRSAQSDSNVRRPVIRTDDAGRNAEWGICQGRIYKFELTDPAESDDENSIGLLKIRSSQPGVRTLKLEVTDDADVRVSLAGHRFDPFEYQDVLTKGFFCSARWGIKQDEEEQKKRTAPKLLRGLEFETLAVEGEIDEIGDDYVVLVKARPKDGQQWPDVAAYLARTARTTDSQKTTRPARKKLELSFVEPVTSFADAAGEPLYLSDFGEEEDVEAVIVYGGRRGLLVEIRSIVAYGDPADDEDVDASQQRRGSSPGTRGNLRP